MFLLPFNRPALAALQKAQKFRKTSTGYLMEQATKPQTLGYNLADSPVGLLAWIYEKLVSWSDDYPWADDEGGFTPLHLRVLGYAPLTPPQ